MKTPTKDIADIYNAKAIRKEKLLKRIDMLMCERGNLISLIDDNLDNPEQRAVLKMFFVAIRIFMSSKIFLE